MILVTVKLRPYHFVLGNTGECLTAGASIFSPKFLNKDVYELICKFLQGKEAMYMYFQVVCIQRQHC